MFFFGGITIDAIQSAYIAGIIDGEGTITLTKLHKGENRRPIISNASTDLELLTYVQTIIGGLITRKRNYSPTRHQNSYCLLIKNKDRVFSTLTNVIPYLRVPVKLSRAVYIVSRYDQVTLRNGRYSEETIKLKKEFEREFFNLK